MSSIIRGDDGFDTAINGKVLQVVNFQTGALATGTTLIPNDDTIPQITEGDEYMTLAITPTSATSKLRIDVVIGMFGIPGSNSQNAVALFVGTTANALASVSDYKPTGGTMNAYSFSHNMTSGVTSTLTFRVRANGHVAGTYTFNGWSGARRHGGVIASSITITEYEV